MFKRIILAALVLMATSGFAQSPLPIEADRVVAVVSSQVITLSELRARVSDIQRQLKARNTPLPPLDQLTQQVLERLIVEQAQLQMAQDSGIQISDEELDAALRRIAEGNRMTLPDFRSALEKDGMAWPAFRDQIRSEMVISRLREREVDSRVNVSDGEVENYMATVAATGDAQLQLNLSHIIVRVPENATPDQLRRLREKAEFALAQLRNGEDFGKVAAGFSDAPDAVSGGVIGLRPADRLPSLYLEEAKKLKPGDVSTVVRSPAGFHIIKLLQRQGGMDNLPALRQTHARHILIKVNDLVSDAEAKRKLESVRERIVNGADFAELARQYSEDLSGAKGGDLGWMNQGDTVPEFEKAMDALKIGDTSALVRSPFGYHLIQVLERRTDEGSPERKRLVAKQALRERKAEEAYEDWVRQLRDKTYVEYKLEDK